MNNNRNISGSRRRASSAGFSLLEVLIGLVILSVGLLGIAALMGTTVKSNDSAYMRTQATVLAYSMIDRMHANRFTATGGASSYDVAMPATAATSDPTTCTGLGAGCSGGMLAAYDVGQWEYDLAKRLPNGMGSITTTTVNGFTLVTITVQWNDSRAQTGLNSGAPAAGTFTLAVSSSL
ncbi:MAG: type IV pilus modification protein PilV [Gammaproteobacteria bacterium]